MDKIYFTVNGEHYTLSGSEVGTDTSLNDYLRNYLHLHGTKAMCHEGGCGACVVSVAQTHPATKERRVFAVNSCLVHILSCHHWDITTIEGVGNRKDGYHKIQSRLAAFNGTQCGYCTPGWIMNMYSLCESLNNKLSTSQIESSFGGNMCRCTGYRPILDAFKTFASDTERSLKDKLQDLEDLDAMECLNKRDSRCSDIDGDWCLLEHSNDSPLTVDLRSSRWYKAFTVQDIFKIFSREGTNDYALIAGNTGKGVYPPVTEPRVHIDISSIATLKDSITDVNLVLGAGMTLNEVMDVFRRRAAENEDFRYLEGFYAHLDLVAHVPVRNIGTIGGNLAMKNAHREFPSDIFLLLETVQSTVTIVNNNLDKKELTMQDFLKENLKGKLILDAKLPPLSSSYLIRTYKIMPRSQNAHAILNAGFLFKVQQGKVSDCAIVLGSIGPEFVRATKTEDRLKGAELFSDTSLQRALATLSDEIKPVNIAPEPSPDCRRNIALGLFYKAILSLSPKVNPRYNSGGTILHRSISSGTQTFDTDKSLWPLNQPVPKLEGLTQCSGEVKYCCDVDTSPRSVQVAFVLSTICVGEIDRFDANDALKIAGVIAFFTAKDIPGRNTFTPSEVPWQENDEEILASKNVSYYGQPLALIAAVTRKLALKAARAVKVYYKNTRDKLVLNIDDALNASDKDRRIRQDITIKPSNRGDDVKHTIRGTYTIGSQYHYTMETQCCTVSNNSRGVSVRSATQWLDLVHVAVAGMLGLNENKVYVTVPRVGGAYGGKASRSALVACACALVAYKMNRTATLVLSLADNMAAVGKRQPCRADWEVGVDDQGMIQYADVTYYSDCGFNFNDSSGGEIASTLTNLYDTSRWSIKGYSVLTDKASNTWCRAPGTTEASAILEHIMERIAYTTKKDPTEIRIQHLASKHTTLKDIINTFKTDTKYEERRVEIAKYNADNAWKKRALKLSIMSYPIGYSGNFPVTVSVYHGDGTIAISHGGIEMGQGINTKVAQVCAYKLKVPLEKVVVRGSDNFVSPNSMASNGSITSDSVCYATAKACEDLLKRLEVAKSELFEPTWEEIVKQAYNKGINLQASYMTSPLDSLTGYDVYGVCALEVELDVLTGNHIILRTDLLEDTGVSISPDIDVGQIEGAFIMGLGLWTSEQLIYNKTTGRLLTDSTWTYKPPGARDIPVDFRVSFKRNSANTAGVLRSKATGEPALVLAVVVTHALYDAICEARKEFGYNDTDWVYVDNPCSVENILKAISPKIENYKLSYC